MTLDLRMDKYPPSPGLIDAPMPEVPLLQFARVYIWLDPQEMANLFGRYFHQLDEGHSPNHRHIRTGFMCM